MHSDKLHTIYFIKKETIICWVQSDMIDQHVKYISIYAEGSEEGLPMTNMTLEDEADVIVNGSTSHVRVLFVVSE